MKRITLLLTLLMFVSLNQFAAVSPGEKKENPKASELFIPIGNTGKQISLLKLSEISRPDFEKLSGHKMKGAQKAGFKLAQKKLRSMIGEDGRVNNKTLQKAAAGNGDGFHIGGFALGFLLGLIGVLIAYLIKDDKKSTRVKWAWIGLGVWVVIVLIAVLV